LCPDLPIQLEVPASLFNTCEFVPAPALESEPERLDATRALRLLDTPPEERFDQVVQLASRIFDAPIAYVALVDADRQWFKAKLGLHVEQTSRRASFCGHAIAGTGAMVVPDTLEDPRFAANPMVLGYPFLRFYAGHPLAVDGRNVGTLCIADQTPRTLCQKDLETLSGLARMVERELALCTQISTQRDQLELKEELLVTQSELARLCGQLQAEKQRADALLLNILPEPVASELKEKGSVRAVHYDSACVLFADFSGFTCIAGQCSPQDLVRELNICFSRFDQIAGRNSVEKLKTVGDCYLCVSGILGRTENAAKNLLQVAFEIRDFVASRQANQLSLGRKYWDVRIGLHAGPLVAGVVGLRKLAFDVWGDTVNVASRLESTGEPGRVNVSRAFLESLTDWNGRVEPRGMIAVKGKDPIEMFWLEPESR
jgi:adenylate cyclase